MNGGFYGPLATLYDDVVVDPCFPAWAAFLHQRWGAQPTTVRRVLDVGCGTGLLAHELIAVGYQVAGIDGSPEMLDRARRRLGAGADLTCSVLPSVPDLGTFDAAVSTFDTLNYLSPDAFSATMHAVAARIRPDGWWVFDVHTDAMLTLMHEQPQSEGEQAGWTFTLDSVTDLAARWCRTRFDATHAASGATVAEEHEQFFFTDDHVISSLTSAGFNVTDVVDEYTDLAATAQTLRATWIARRN